MYGIKPVLVIGVLLFSLIAGVVFERWIRHDPSERLRHLPGFSLGIGLTVLVIALFLQGLVIRRISKQ